MAAKNEFEQATKRTTSNASAQSPSDKLAAMRSTEPIPGRTITHSYIPATGNMGRPILEDKEFFNQLLTFDDD